MDKIKFKKIGGLVLDISIYVFFAICVVVLIGTIMAKQSSDGAITLFGKQMRIVVSESMEKSDAVDVSGYEIKDIPIRSLVFIDTVPEDTVAAKAWYDKLKVGDVLTFKYVITAQQDTITHRITEKEEKDGGYIIKLQGDNRSSEGGVMTQTIDTTLASKSPNYIIGKVTGHSLFLGAALNFLKEPIGIVLFIILPSLIIMVYEIYKLFGALNEKKRRADEEKHLRQEAEMEMLKLQLDMLRSGDTAAEICEKQQEPCEPKIAAPAAAAEESAQEIPKTEEIKPAKTDTPQPQPAQQPQARSAQQTAQPAQPQMPPYPYYYPMMPQMPPPPQGQAGVQAPQPYPMYYVPYYPQPMPQPVYPVYYVPCYPPNMPPQCSPQHHGKKKMVKAAKRTVRVVYVKKPEEAPENQDARE